MRVRVRVGVRGRPRSPLRRCCCLVARPRRRWRPSRATRRGNLVSIMSRVSTVSRVKPTSYRKHSSYSTVGVVGPAEQQLLCRRAQQRTKGGAHLVRVRVGVGVRVRVRAGVRVRVAVGVSARVRARGRVPKAPRTKPRISGVRAPLPPRATGGRGGASCCRLGRSAAEVCSRLRPTSAPPAAWALAWALS